MEDVTRRQKNTIRNNLLKNRFQDHQVVQVCRLYQRPLSHERSNQVCLSVFQVDLIRWSKYPYGPAGENGLVPIYSRLPTNSIQSAKKNTEGDPFPSVQVDSLIGQSSVNGQLIPLHLTAHTAEWALSVSALHKSANRSPELSQADAVPCKTGLRVSFTVTLNQSLVSYISKGWQWECC